MNMSSGHSIRAEGERPRARCRRTVAAVLSAIAITANCGVADQQQLSASGRACPPPRESDNLSHPDFADFLRYKGRYYGLTRQTTPIPADMKGDVLGRRLGTVQCQLTTADTDGYDIRSGDAAFLEPGTPFFARKGKPIETQILVRREDRSLIVYRSFRH